MIKLQWYYYVHTCIYPAVPEINYRGINMKKMLIFAAIIIIASGFIIGDALRISKYVETWTVDNLKEPDLEKAAYFNIKYMDFVGNFDRTIELIDKYNTRYEGKSAKIPELIFMSAKVYEKKMQPAKVREILKMYIETYPDQKNIEDAKTMLRENTPSI